MDQLFARKQNVGSISGILALPRLLNLLCLWYNIIWFLILWYYHAGRNFTCSKTKTATIVNCIGDHFFDELKERMTQSHFSIMLDGNNDTDLQNIHPVTVRTFYVNFNYIMTKFFDMDLLGTDASTAASMFDSVNNLFDRYNIQWDHCMGIGLNNTNANTGKLNSIKSRARQKNDNIIIAIHSTT